MTTSQNRYDSIENIIFNEGLKISSVDYNANHDEMYVRLNNNHSFVIPVKLYKGLSGASEKDLRNYELIANATGIHWPALDEDLSLKGFLKDFLIRKIHSEDELILSVA